MAREMKDSGIEWIGEIPKSWITTKIKNLPNNEENSYIDGDWIESPYITDNGIRYLTTGNIGDGHFKEQGDGYISEDTFVALKCKYAYPGDLVFSRLNEPYGRSCILPNFHPKYVLAVDNVILRTNENKSYICYISQCKGFQNSVLDMARGTTMKRISRINLGSVIIPLPSNKEQNLIASFLDSKCAEIDKAVEAIKASIEEYKKLRQAIITEAVTKGLDPDVEMKDSGFIYAPLIPKRWHVIKITRLIDRSNNYPIGDGDHGLVSPKDYCEQGIPYIRVQNLGWGTDLITDNIVYISEDTNALIKGSTLKPNDVLFAKTGATIGKTGIVPKEMPIANTTSHVGKITISNEYNARFIFYQLSSSIGYKQMWDFASLKTTRPELALDEIKTMKFIVPESYETQQIIVDYLDSKCSEIDSLIKSKEKLIEELTAYRKSLIYEYVTGKKEVPVEPA